jgi:hypothetical protein
MERARETSGKHNGQVSVGAESWKVGAGSKSDVLGEDNRAMLHCFMSNIGEGISESILCPSRLEVIRQQPLGLQIS